MYFKGSIGDQANAFLVLALIWLKLPISLHGAETEDGGSVHYNCLVINLSSVNYYI